MSASLPEPVRGPVLVECSEPLPAAPECELTGEGSELVVHGDVLAPGKVYLGGSVRVLADGTIGCAGCRCDDGTPARHVRCPDSVVSPAFVNPHDHVAYAHQPPRPASAERYEHRHDWRLGVRGHLAIPYEGGAPAVVRAAHELRLLLGGATTVAGGAGHRGLLRNPDLPDLGEGLPSAPADSDTFPLDDASGLLLEDGCAYGDDHTREADVERYGGYLPHLGEGIDRAAENELSCALDRGFDLIQPNTAVVHAVAPTAEEAAELGARKALVVWSPRSNLSLYGNTAPATLLRNSGVELALGTDWLLSGSMNVLRELACARSFSSRYLPGAFDDVDLFRMVTDSAARAVGARGVLGRLAPGALADLIVVRRRELDPHSAVVTAGPADIELVLRGGTPLYGRATLLEGLADPSCEAFDVCGSLQRACTGETGFGLAELRAAAEAAYPLFSCETPPNEPACVPARPGEYDGTASAQDQDGDGVPDRDDLCPTWFDPIRPADAGAQPDADRDGMGDACDPCPLDADVTCTSRIADDRDGDGIANDLDVCPDEPDRAQADADGDGIGDACDFCSAPNPGVTPCPLSITTLRNPEHPEHPPRHALLELPLAEVVALRPDVGSARGYYVQEGVTARAGIFAYTGSMSPGVALGDRVALRGRYDRYYDSDQLVVLGHVQHEPGTPSIAPLLTIPAEIADGGSLSAAFEQMLVRVENASVRIPNPDAPSDYDEFELEGGLRVDDLLYPELDNAFANGTTFSSLTGVLTRSFDHFKLCPRGPEDVVF